MDAPLTPAFEKFQYYAQKACQEWNQKDEVTILPSPTLPIYSKTDKFLNETRATAGKWAFKAVVALRGPFDPTDRITKPSWQYGETARRLWSWISRLGVHTWNSIFLPTYHAPGKLDTSFSYSVVQMMENGISGFDAWRARTHPDCGMQEAEQANRLVAFGIIWALLDGRRELSLAELEALWSYAMLYPLVDNVMDAPGLASNRQTFVRELRSVLHGGTVSMNMFLYHPKRQSLLLSLASVHAALLSKGSIASEDAFGALEILALLEGQELSASSSMADRLFQACMKGGLAMLPAVVLLGGSLTSEPDYVSLFKYGLAAQLVDDLQDWGQDERSGRSTIFTASINGPSNISAVTKTFNYLASESFYKRPSSGMVSKEAEWLRLALARMITYLAVESVLLGEAPRRLPYSFVYDLKRMAPLGCRFMQQYSFERTLYRASGKFQIT